MSATDELRRLLDERGVEWWEGDDERKTLWESNGLTWEYFNDENGYAWLGFLGACEQDVTPEQAIAATLGGVGSEVGSEVCGGKLTAEQVMAIAGRHQPDYCSDTHVCFDWQAITDELNAALGSGECEVIKSDNGLKCSHCGKELPYDPYADYEGNFCATCGARLGYGRR